MNTMQIIKKYGFSHADRTIMKKDWSEVLPDMGLCPNTKYIIFRRIVGPLTICFNVELDSRMGAKQYSVRYYIHNLAVAEEFWTGGILAYPHTKYSYIEFKDHKDEYEDVAASMKENAWIPLDGPITLDDIFNGYSNAAKYKMRHYQDDYEKSLEGLTKTFESLGGNAKRAKDMIDYGDLTLHEAPTPALVAAWAGEPEKAKEYLDWAYKVAGWEGDKMLELYAPLIDQPELLRATARAERIKHGLTYAPCQNIVGVPYKETWQD